MPGFLFKNQRLNRSPPNIEIVPLETGPIELCPVNNLATYLKGSPPTRGKLFVNSRTNKPLHSSSISKLLCELINEADPGLIPQAHDVRRIATSIAWTRGLDPLEITKRTFWSSSNVFIERYLSARNKIVGVALNTQ